MGWAQLLLLILAGLVIWFLFRTIRTRPQLFSKENLSKSFSTMGILALILIAFVAFCIFLIRNT